MYVEFATLILAVCTHAFIAYTLHVMKGRYCSADIEICEINGLVCSVLLFSVHQYMQNYLVKFV